MPTALVIGASSGVGLSLAEHLIRQGWDVFVTARRNCAELDATQATVIEGVDTTQEDCCSGILHALGTRRLDLLIVSAGSQEVDTIETVTRDSIRRQFEVNALGPLFLVKGLQSSLSDGSKVALISSKNGSITEVDFTGGELYGYRMSKVALNMAGVVLARDLKSRGICVALIHPGVVNTGMLRSLRKARGVLEDKLTANTLSAAESAAKIMGVLGDLNSQNSGSFWAADTGKSIGW